MAEETLHVVRLKQDFYRDGFYRVLIIFVMMMVVLILLIGSTCYLFFVKPDPVYFSVDKEGRTLPPVAVDQPYLKTPDLMQWISVTLPAVFTYDFIHYNDQLKQMPSYFTEEGWKRFLDQINVYANATTVQTNKLFINASPTSAPFILNQGLLLGKYAWWIQMPFSLHTINYKASNTLFLVAQILVVRVPTLNNLMGVAIDNVIISRGGES